MDKYQKMFIRYAENRVILSDIKILISNLVYGDPETGDFIDLKKHYEDYHQTEFPDEYLPRWEGWVHCLKFLDNDYDDNELELAILLDQKKEIIREGGQIKRNICTMGRALIKRN